MSIKVDNLPDLVAGRIREYYNRRRFFAFARLLLWTVVLYAVLTLVATHIDRFTFLSDGDRWLLSAVSHGATLGFVITWLVLFFVRRPTLREVVYELEDCLPAEVEERFSTLADVSDRDPAEQDALSRGLVEQLRQDAVAFSEGFHGGRLVKDDVLPRLGIAAGIAVLLICGLFFVPRYQFGLMFRRCAMPWRDLPKPSFVSLRVDPEGTVVGKGGELIVEASTRGEVPAPLRWLMEKLGSVRGRCTIAMESGSDGSFSSQRASRHDMSRVHNDLFVFSRTDLQETFRYQVRYADAQTQVHTVTVMEQPRVTGLQLQITPPGYTGLQARVVRDPGGGVEVLKGAEVQVSFGTDRPVRERVVIFEGQEEEVVPEWNSDTRRGACSFEVSEPRTIEIKVVDEHGFSNVDRRPVKILVRNDQSPTVTMKVPPARAEKLPGELLPVEAEARDDLGIVQMSLQYRLNPDQGAASQWQEKGVSLEGGKHRDLRVNTALELDELNLVPGDMLAVRLRARDAAGNDGVSRESFIRIVPVTRGVNERLRLLRLDFIRRAVATVTEGDHSDDESSSLLSEPAYQSLRELARKNTIQLGEKTGFGAILRLLQREHHFTDRAVHKRDVRQLYGVLRHMVKSRVRESAQGSGVGRLNRLRQLGEEVLPGLINYRRLKNITWRLFGMYYEAGRIGEELRAGARKNALQSDRERALKRRARLYLDTLQDIGKELIDLSETSDAIDSERVLRNFGEINAAAFYLRQGSLSARAEACRKLISLLPNMLAITRSALVPLQEAEVRSRRRLREMYENSLQAVREDAGPEDATEAGKWLAADLEMLQRNPFSPLATRLKRYASASPFFVPDSSGESPTGGASASGNPLAELEETSRKRQMFMSVQWEAEQVVAMEKISNQEKALELLTMHLERTVTESASGEREKIKKQIPSIEMGNGLTEKRLLEIKRSLLHQRGAAMADSLGTQNRLRDFMNGWGDELSAEALLSELVDNMERSGEAIRRLSSALEDGEGDGLEGRVQEITEGLSRQTRLMQWLEWRLYFDLAVAGARGAARVDHERLMLQVRELSGRYLGRVEKVLESLEEGIQQAGQLDVRSASADLEQIRYVHQAIQNSFQDLLRSVSQPESQAGGEKDRVPRSYEAAWSYERVLKDLIEGGHDAALARKFIAAHPEAGVVHLLANQKTLDAATESLNSARKILSARAPETAGYRESLSEAKKAVARFREIVAESGDGRLQEKLSGEITVLNNRLEALEDDAETFDEGQISRLEYGLGQARRTLDTLKRSLDRAQRGPAEQLCEFTGGPAGIWMPEWRIHARRTRERLQQQSRFAQINATGAVLAAMGSGDHRVRYLEGHAWATFLRRLAISSLCATESRSPGGDQEEEKRDPHKAFLMAELEKALKADKPQDYQEMTEEYLRAVQDYLRY